MPTSLPESAREALLELARASIERALAGERLEVRLADYPAALNQPRGTFVTLHVGDDLRGCIGSLEAYRPLALDVAENARAAALHDPRFAPVATAELGQLHIHISILSPPQPLHVRSEHELLAQLRPGIDGLTLTERHCRGTFLPAVWDTLPEPREFVRALKQKAGLAPDYWSDSITVERYTAESVP